MPPVTSEKLLILEPEMEKLTIKPSTTLSAPANKMSVSVPNQICNNVLDAIGCTPIIRLNKVASSLDCEVVVKCEFFNAGGSVKDRIGKRMVDDAEAEGKIHSGQTLIEPTSGNTGIGLALTAAVKGYRCIIVLPEKMSKEKVDVLKALGAEIVRTPTEAAYDAPDSHISVAKRLNSEIDDSYILDQYKNPSNPLAHYDGTAEEIWKQCDGKVDMLVCGVGTGGTISGVAKKLKEYNPNIIVVGVDPEGSILAQPENLNEGPNRLQPYQVEGIGYDFIPDVLDRSLIDQWYKSNDSDSLVMMRRLIRDEGLLCGGSSGAAVNIALLAAKTLKKGQRCVVILPDSVRNYMTKALSDDWMVDHGFVDNDVIKPKRYDSCWWADKHISDIVMTTPLTITEDVTCREAITLLKEEGFDMVPVLNADNEVVGVVTEGNMSSMILQGRVDPDASVSQARVMYKQFTKVKMNDKLSELAKWFDHEPFALVITEQRCFGYKRKQLKAASDAAEKDVRNVVTKSVISGIVTRIDLLDFISQEVACNNSASTFD